MSSRCGTAYTTLTVAIMVGLQTAVLSSGKGSYGQEPVEETCSQTLLSLYPSPLLKMNRSFEYLDDFCHGAHTVYAHVSYSQWNQGSIWLKLLLVLWSGVLMPAIWLKPRDRHYMLQIKISFNIKIWTEIGKTLYKIMYLTDDMFCSVHVM